MEHERRAPGCPPVFYSDPCFIWRAGERPGIVVLTIGLEESLPKLPASTTSSKLWSPYRLPLIRFLNQYPCER